jgi:thiamine pyrophosphokinase
VGELKTRCYIAGAGEFADQELPSRDDYIIAADAGYLELTSRDITPDLVIGDFDSLGGLPQHPNIIQSPAEKDDTDVMLAVNYGLSCGFETFIINGCLGGRLDHTLANIQILVYIAKRGARGILIGRDLCATAITNGTASFASDAKGYISVFSAGSIANGVSLTGLKYPLDNAALTCDYPLGVSNEFTGVPATVSVCDGTLIIIWTGGIDISTAIHNTTKKQEN